MAASVCSASWNYPTRIHAGPGRVAELAEACRGLGMEAPLLVTDPGLSGQSIVAEALQRCRDRGLRAALFDGVKGNPTGDNVEQGLEAFRQGKHDGVIAFGGGSPLDAGKAIALMAGQTRSLWDFEDSGDNWARADERGIAPVVAVPTTAGTGSEVGRASVILDELAGIKRIIFHPRMLPATVILDPELTVGLPPDLTAATGMDALSHNLEALCAPGWHPMADGIALEGMRLVHQHLPRACADGGDLEARMNMLVASTMGATAFQKGLGAMHALAHPLGAIFDAHHGLLNAILMPYVLEENRLAIEDKLDGAARYLGIAGGYCGFLDWVMQLRAEIGIPDSLSMIGIKMFDAEQIGVLAAKDPSAAGNPVSLDAAGYAALFERAVSGATPWTI